MQHSGIDPIDGAIGGLAVGRVHILTGPPGAGKSAAGLQFLAAGLRRGEPALLLTSQHPRALRTLAMHMGVDLRLPLLEERLVLLRYGHGFARRLGQATTTAAAAVGELRAAIGSLAPTRVVIDSVLPFLDDGTAAGSAIATLADLLASAGATTLVTCPGDLTHAYDRRLDALVQSAAAVVHLAPDAARRGVSRVEVVKGPAAPAAPDERPRHVALVAGRGLVPAPRVAREALAGADHGDAPARARTGALLLLHESPLPEPETLAMLQRDHAVTARPAQPALDAALGAAQGVDAVVLEVSHHTLDQALALVHALARRDGAPPVLTVARFNVRSADRARLLRAGADDTLAGDMSAAELRHRLAAAIARGHVPSSVPPAARDEPQARQPIGSDGRPLLLDEARFVATLAACAAQDPAESGSVVELVVDRAELDDLAQLAMRSMRAQAGDLAARVDDLLLVYLHGARRRDTSSFVERIRTDWSRRPRSPLRITVRPHPPGVAGLRDAPAAVPA